MQPDYCETNAGYLAAGVVIHMDDPEMSVQVRGREGCARGAGMSGTAAGAAVICGDDSKMSVQSCVGRCALVSGCSGL